MSKHLFYHALRRLSVAGVVVDLKRTVNEVPDFLSAELAGKHRLMNCVLIPVNDVFQCGCIKVQKWSSSGSGFVISSLHVAPDVDNFLNCKLSLLLHRAGS